MFPKEIIKHTEQVTLQHRWFMSSQRALEGPDFLEPLFTEKKSLNEK